MLSGNLGIRSIALVRGGVDPRTFLDAQSLIEFCTKYQMQKVQQPRMLALSRIV